METKIELAAREESLAFALRVALRKRDHLARVEVTESVTIVFAEGRSTRFNGGLHPFAPESDNDLEAFVEATAKSLIA